MSKNKKEKSENVLPEDEARRLIEAMIFASTAPVTNEILQEKLGKEGKNLQVAPLMEALAAEYKGRGIELAQIAGGWMFRTSPDLAGKLSITIEARRKLPRVTAETLAIIAYHQPVTRAEIESIRGVATARETLDALMELGWVRPGKRRETPGRPLTWITTDVFLRHFGLGSLKDLPGVQELREAGLLDARPVLSTFTSADAEEAAAIPEEEGETLEYLPDTLDEDEKEARTG